MRRLAYLSPLILALLVATFGSAAPGEKASYVEDIHNPIEVSAKQINQILTPEFLQGEVSYEGDLPEEVVNRLVRQVLSSLSFKDYHQREGNLDERGCMQTNVKEIAWSFVPENYFGTTLDEVVSSADIAFLGRITSRELGFVSQHFFSRYTVDIEEVWLPAPDDLRTRDKITYRTPEYDFTVAGERICVTYDSAPIPSEGETLLFLAITPDAEANSDQRVKELTVTNFFRMDGSLVLPAPYTFLKEAAPMKLDELKQHRRLARPSARLSKVQSP